MESKEVKLTGQFRHTKEFHEMRAQFEKDLLDMPFYVAGRLTRADVGGAPSHVFYDNGEINNLFHAYMCGYQLAKSLNP